MFDNKLTSLNIKKNWLLGHFDDLTREFAVLSYVNTFYIISNDK